MKTSPSPNFDMTLPMTMPTRTSGREVVVFKTNKALEPIPGGRVSLSESPLKPILTDISARAISPRNIKELSLDLYAGGIISWEEHEDLAFQVDLHPDFPRTIGALTGEKPLPDQPRDYVKEWEQRLDFENRHAPEGPKHQRALRILSVLRRIDSPTNIDA